MPDQLLAANADAVAYQLEECKNSGFFVILHSLNSFQHSNLVAFSLLYVLLRENHKINAACFPLFHNGCNPACQKYPSKRYFLFYFLVVCTVDLFIIWWLDVFHHHKPNLKYDTFFYLTLHLNFTTWFSMIRHVLYVRNYFKRNIVRRL